MKENWLSRTGSLAAIISMTALLVSILGVALPARADCASDNGCYCGDGNCPTLGCCGDVGQRICIVHSVFSDCNSECKPGLVYRSSTATCEKPCSYCDDVGFCCGGE